MKRALLCLLCAGCLSTALSLPANANIWIEAQDYTTYGDLGGLQVEAGFCEGALDSIAVDGVDWPGEWIEWNLDLPADSCFVFSMRAAWTEEQDRTYEVEFWNDHDILVSHETTQTGPGHGAG